MSFYRTNLQRCKGDTRRCTRHLFLHCCTASPCLLFLGNLLLRTKKKHKCNQQMKTSILPGFEKKNSQLEEYVQKLLTSINKLSKPEASTVNASKVFVPMLHPLKVNCLENNHT